ncbi:bifunctional 5,10-methylenetetrahydrofolate dehydrogenase/5,10-methenyltetrahydrofolate cyclohydrolase [Sporolituus thermophilus]|uniref:Bifunctional protein FolD n=1 Tax=Sporolituus thermophilus DSM 23256 TaxID=1123285 RepID=A0A1G7JW47_9FIRM|nr:tetrahydrofolate dehydrogenase/cyclohydrolase catalytic domain-containing protein [Sporolituus thermophilus]SDF29132.1 5,10-methylenetetrahydrofolate dehydrogenase (NADP+) [Sporolituus thermophilus DSM 23256]
MALILDGKAVAAAYKAKIKAKVDALAARNITCGLAILLVGDDAASRIYADRLVKLATGLGVRAVVRHLPADAAEEEVLTLVRELNADGSIHGILPMMPLPPHLAADRVAAALAPDKDVDALHPLNAGLVATGKSRWAPCTPRAVMAILAHYHIDVSGKHAVIIGRSNVVGKPLAHLLLGQNATVTVCHSKTGDLAALTRQADVLIAAAGRPALIGPDMVRPGAVVIDVGINEVNGAVVGDVAYDAVLPVAAAITPVPGGVGAVTTVMVVEAALRNFGDL